MSNPIRILLLEDSAVDAELTREELESVKILNEQHVAVNGEEAMEFLRKEGRFKDAPRPDLILLDLNMPRKDGRAVLAEIEADLSLRSIPVVVMTSSKAEEDIVKSYNLQASAYVTKPVDLQGFSKIVSGIEYFWFSVVHFPPES